MADLFDDFMDDIIDIVNETPDVTANPAIANPTIPLISFEDYRVLLSPPAHIEAETPNK